MSNQNLFFKQNAMIEPLVNNWYAWSLLIAPASLAMYTAYSHLKLLQSFVNNPQVHMAAVRNPAMLGGHYLNFDISQVEDIQALIDDITKNQTDLLKFAEAIKALDTKLMSEATGHSLEGMYKEIPDILRGYVELVYDLNHIPSFRFIEGLLYKSRFYHPELQRITLSLIESDDRPFVFTNPRVKNADLLSLNIPFKDERLDRLFSMRQIPQPLEEIRDMLQIAPSDFQRFNALFTETAPQTPSSYHDDGVRMRYYGHACVLVETKDLTILVDPVINYTYDNGIQHYTFADLPETIDYVLITHNHQDHVMFETLLQLRYKIKHLVVPKSNIGSLVDPSLKLILQQVGFKNVIELDEMEEIHLGDVVITGLPFFGEHGDLNVRCKIAYLINAKDRQLLFVADSNNLEPTIYDYIHDITGDIDMLFLGMECDGAPVSWLYGPLMTKSLARKMDQSRRFDGSDCKKGMAIVDRLKPKHVYVYAMGQEPWLTYLTSIKYNEDSRPIIESNRLVQECRERGILSERLYCHKEIYF